MTLITHEERFLSFLWTVSKNLTIFLPRNIVRGLNIQEGELVNIYTLEGQTISAIVSRKQVIYLPRKLALAIGIQTGDLVAIELRMKERRKEEL